MACTVIHTDPQHIKLVNKQINELFKSGKEPTIKDPFITFMYEIYKNLKIIKIVKEVGHE
jgi:hypothetical protein